MVYIIKKPILMVLYDTALIHFLTLISLESYTNVNLRLFVHNPCTEGAQINLVYCYSGEEVINDIKVKMKNFSLFVDNVSIESLKNTDILFEKNTLIMKAPNVKGKNIFTDSSFKKKILLVLEKEVNPILLLHGGFVRLVGIVKTRVLLLEFGGTCVGCGLLSVTLEKTVKRIIKRNFPEIKNVLDYSKINK